MKLEEIKNEDIIGYIVYDQRFLVIEEISDCFIGVPSEDLKIYKDLTSHEYEEDSFESYFHTKEKLIRGIKNFPNFKAFKFTSENYALKWLYNEI